ncbi:MAG TPA: hypothetical protein VNB49_10570 [Candidatus Dormibacteraeota bacterium]|nr:hypothetical protein [Candidatus Dormibacteraeota bacterium]
MGEESEQVTAAATGAAAAVAAVQDEQAEAERAAGMEAATVDASIAAEQAAEHAEEAAEAATAATEAAVEATEVAQQASGTAAAAADEAYSVRDDVAALRSEMQQGWQDLRAHLDETFGSKKIDEPTEVTVTHERTDPSSEQRDNSGSANSTGNEQGGSGSQRVSRHRFGRSRG